jgi:hypothetical protein
MKWLKLSASLLVTSTLLPFLPAQAGPFDSSKGVFSRSATSTPVNNLATSPTGRSSTNNAPGSEVAPLGTHNSWLQPQIFTKNPKALCDTEDVGLGNDTTASNDKTTLNSSNSNAFNRDSSNNDSGGGGGSVLFGLVSANGSGRAQSTDNNNGSSRNQLGTTQDRTRTSSKVRVGQKVSCGSTLEWSAKRDMNYEDNLTKRYEIKMGRNAQQVDGLLAYPKR